MVLRPLNQPRCTASARPAHAFQLPSCPAFFCACVVAFGSTLLSAQVITIDTSGKAQGQGESTVDRQYSQIEPTHIDLPKGVLDTNSRLDLIRALEREQGFAMRPFPRGHRGLTLEANGKLNPAGTAYLNMVINEGLSAKPGSRVVITDIKFDKNKIVFDLNDGPDAKHRFMRHIQIGVGPDMGDSDVDPSVANQAGDPVGARLTLTFKDSIPVLTPQQVKALLAPMISFDVKTPIQAYTDTLPKELKEAILGHKVWVGMNTDMVLFAKGQPLTKSRESEGQMPFEEWVYGASPEEVDFVRINGNRVIRVEIAKDGQPLQIFTQDVVMPLMQGVSAPVMASNTKVRVVKEGDVQPDTDRQAPAPPPTLRAPGEALPNDSAAVGVMRPVQMPKPHTDDQLGANPDEQQEQTAPAADSQKQPAASGTAAPASGTPQAKPQSPPVSTPPAANFVQASAADGRQTKASGAAQPN